LAARPAASPGARGLRLALIADRAFRVGVDSTLVRGKNSEGGGRAGIFCTSASGAGARNARALPLGPWSQTLHQKYTQKYYAWTLAGSCSRALVTCAATPHGALQMCSESLLHVLSRRAAHPPRRPPLLRRSIPPSLRRSIPPYLQPDTTRVASHTLSLDHRPFCPATQPVALT